MNINIIKLFKNKYSENIIIAVALITLIYLLVSIYFNTHFFFNTVINGADVSLKAHNEVGDIIRRYIEGYKLQLVERNGEIEEISGQDIELQYNEINSISRIYQMQDSMKWIGSLSKSQKYYVENLYIYNEVYLNDKIKNLNCINKVMIEPQNVSFKYTNGSYETVKELYGNKINVNQLDNAIRMSISKGKAKLDLNNNDCYENPKYTLYSNKTPKTKDLLNMYVSTKINYLFGSKIEILDGDIINEWLVVDENLDVIIDKKAAFKYINRLGKSMIQLEQRRNLKPLQVNY